MFLFKKKNKRKIFKILITLILIVTGIVILILILKGQSQNKNILPQIKNPDLNNDDMNSTRTINNNLRRSNNTTSSATPKSVPPIENAPPISCLNERGEIVGWWTILKIPKHSQPPSSGYDFFYTDPHHSLPVLFPNSLNQTTHPLAYTLNQIYTGGDNIGRIMYNDEPPEMFKNIIDSQHYGHTKGVVGFDNQTGFWLTHSVPKFPPPTFYQYPESGSLYGQSMFCFSINTFYNNVNQVNEIGKLFKYSNPKIYNHYVPSQLERFVPDLMDVFLDKGIVTEPGYTTSKLFTSHGSEFINSIVQSSPSDGRMNPPFYQEVANFLHQDLYVESWLRGDKTGPLCDQPYQVNDIITISCGFNSNKYSWTETRDHSKWAVPVIGPNICFGDLNRMKSQGRRGGGVVCLRNPRLHSTFFGIIGNHTKCFLEEKENMEKLVKNIVLN